MNLIIDKLNITSLWDRYSSDTVSSFQNFVSAVFEGVMDDSDCIGRLGTLFDDDPRVSSVLENTDGLLSKVSFEVTKLVSGHSSPAHPLCRIAQASVKDEVCAARILDNCMKLAESADDADALVRATEQDRRESLFFCSDYETRLFERLIGMIFPGCGDSDAVLHVTDESRISSGIPLVLGDRITELVLEGHGDERKKATGYYLALCVVHSLINLEFVPAIKADMAYSSLQSIGRGYRSREIAVKELVEFSAEAAVEYSDILVDKGNRLLRQLRDIGDAYDVRLRIKTGARMLLDKYLKNNTFMDDDLGIPEQRQEAAEEFAKVFEGTSLSGAEISKLLDIYLEYQSVKRETLRCYMLASSSLESGWWNVAYKIRQSVTDDAPFLTGKDIALIKQKARTRLSSLAYKELDIIKPNYANERFLSKNDAELMHFSYRLFFTCVVSSKKHPPAYATMETYISNGWVKVENSEGYKLNDILGFKAANRYLGFDGEQPIGYSELKRVYTKLGTLCGNTASMIDDSLYCMQNLDEIAENTPYLMESVLYRHKVLMDCMNVNSIFMEARLFRNSPEYCSLSREQIIEKMLKARSSINSKTIYDIWRNEMTQLGCDPSEYETTAESRPRAPEVIMAEIEKLMKELNESVKSNNA